VSFLQCLSLVWPAAQMREVKNSSHFCVACLHIIEEMVPIGPPLQREEGQAPATIQPAEAQIEEVVAPGTPQAQLQDPVVPQADVSMAPSASPIPRRPTVRSTRGMASQRMTYEVKGDPTAYFLAECFQTMIQGLVTCVNQREHQQREFLAMMSSTNGTINNWPQLLQEYLQLLKQVTKVIQILKCYGDNEWRAW